MTRPEASKLLIGPEQKFSALRKVSPFSAREWELLDKRLAARNEMRRGQYLREACGDFDISDLPDFRTVKMGYDWN